MIFYAYCQRKVRLEPPADAPPRGGKAPAFRYVTTYLGVVKAKNGKLAMARAIKKWPKAKLLDLLNKKFVRRRETRTIRIPR